MENRHGILEQAVFEGNHGCADVQVHTGRRGGDDCGAGIFRADEPVLYGVREFFRGQVRRRARERRAGFRSIRRVKGFFLKRVL